MAFAKILSLSSYLPENTVDNYQLSERYPEWDVDKISGKTGITSRPRAGRYETALDLGVHAAKRLFLQSEVSVDVIDALIFCTQCPDYILPPNSCLAHAALGLPPDIPTYDIAHACSGFISALSLASALIHAEQCRNILIITSDTYSKYMSEHDKTVQTIFSDGASACIVGKSLTQGLSCFVHATDGEGAKNLIVPLGGCKSAAVLEHDLYGNTLTDGMRGLENLYMNGQEIFVYTLATVPRLIARMLEKAGLGLDDIDKFVFHQANAYMLEHLRKKLSIPQEKFIVNLQKVGNVTSSTIPIALEMARGRGEIKAGEKLLLAGFGVGYSSSACLAVL